MELIPAPGILFLDEPTTGLDASTAMNVMRLLKRCLMKGRIGLCYVLHTIELSEGDSS